MAVEIILAVRNARERERLALGDNAEDNVIQGSREHRDLMSLLTKRAVQRLLGEGISGKPGKEDGDWSAQDGRFVPFAIRADKMLARMSLEHHMWNVAMKLPLFLICMFCFIWAISLLSPAASVSAVHQQLIGHFDVTKDRFDSIVSFDDIYAFVADFEAANVDLQASSAKFWCEKRYFEHTWNDELLLPDRACPSPRLAALGVETDTPTTWGAWKAASAPSASSASSSSGASAHRRLMERRLASETATAGSAAASSEEPPPCVDDDEELKLEEGDPSITCSGSASHICEIDLGVVLCPKTCGYCAPFEYEHAVFFDKPQVTMLPVMVHQTRYPMSACDFFAETFETQPFNRDLATSPPLDGVRNGRVLTCIDRNKQLDDEFAFQLECPKEGAPENMCANGKMPFSKVYTYHSESVYAQFLTEPTKDLAAMQAVDWIDLQTSKIVVSTLVYTEGLEIFTSISAEFRVDAAGNIQGHNAMVSYTDLTRSKRTTFTALLVIVCLGSLAGVAINAWQLMKSKHCKWGLQTFELISRSSMCVYALVLLLTWMNQVPMSEEYDHLLHAVLDFHGNGHAEFDNLVQTYFDAKTLIYEETQWLMSHRITIYLILYLQFAQLIAYFAVHPRLAMLTDTIAGALDHMIHFFMLFVVIFLMLAFMASWMLGGDVHAFKSFGEAVASQGKMLFGEWIYADNADDLHGAMVGMYWLYAISFMLVLFFTLLNFFLAIVVEAFVVVKGNITDDPTEQNLVMDIADLFSIRLTFRRFHWGSHGVLLKALQEAVHARGADEGPQLMDLKQFAALLPQAAQNAESLTNFVRTYAHKCPSTIAIGSEAAGAAEAVQVDPRVQSLDDAFQGASKILRPALVRMFDGIGEATWSYEKTFAGGHYVHRVSANFVRERPAGQVENVAEMIVGGMAMSSSVSAEHCLM